MINHKRRYPAMPRKRRFLALTPSAGVNASGRALERSQRENEELRKTIRRMVIWAEMEGGLYDPLELLDRVHEIGSKVQS